MTASSTASGCRRLIPLVLLLAAIPTARAGPDASATPPARASTATAPPPGGAAADNAIKKLFDAHQFAAAISQVEKLRAAAGGGHIADADSEYWAARAEFAQKQFAAAGRRYELIVAQHPESPRAPEAAVGALAAQLAPLGDKVTNKQDHDAATRIARDLEAARRKYMASRPDVAAKASFIAGNAWRMALEDKESVAAYEEARRILPDGEYASRAAQLLAVLASRSLDNDKARELYKDCANRYAKTDSGAKCADGLRTTAMVGKPAPPFVVETWLNSPARIQPEAMRGNVVLVWFFETWCPHCQATMPEIATYAEHYKGQPFRIVAITDNTESQTTESARAFVADPQWGMSYPVAVDLTGKTTAAYPTAGTPSAVLIDKKGIIRWADSPVFFSPDMIERLLAE